MGYRKWIAAVTGLLLCVTGLMGCGEVENSSGTEYKIYYVNNEETKVISESYATETTDTNLLLQEILEQLGTIPEKLEYEAPLASGFTLQSTQLEQGQLLLDMDNSYKSLSATKEVLVRAALVRTLTQISGVDFVAITINGEPLTDNLGNLLGAMSADMFIDNAGKEINSYEKASLRLYFTNADGNQLIATNREVVYNSNISMEKLVVEQLILGPNLDGVYPTISSSAKLVNVTVKDRICYVNFDSGFLLQQGNTTPEVTLYSVTNSLVELPNINKVQISVDGETNVMFRENTSLTTLFERNLDLVE
ncbi:MAG: GerMN domain-containing protein [Lachnospiraceae bacterium]|nr:GerMN domain-containing protein [Lachnospiraceae bacterium]